jgi:hypothetical protein
MLLPRILAVFLLLGLLCGIYLLWVRPSQLRWGATDEEVQRPMPGYDLVVKPNFKATRAVTIEGKPEEIWPWLVQMGYGRAGFYGYDLIENFGSKRGLRSAESILPELQQLTVGDELPISYVASLVVHSIDPNRFLVWADQADPPSSAFTWGLYPLDENQTRLISRIHLQYHWTRPWIVIDLFTDFADHVAVRKLLLGTKDRVEGRVEPMAQQNAEMASWLVSFLVFITATVSIFFRQSWWREWLVAVAAAAVLLITLYLHPPLWLGVFLVTGVLGSLLGVLRHQTRDRFQDPMPS